VNGQLFDTYDLFAPKPPRQVQSETSVEAAESITAKAGTLRLEVLEFIQFSGDHGATDEQIQTCLKMNPSTQRPRRIELVRGGYVVDSGRTRQTAAGRNATVWVAVGGGK